MSDEVSDFLRSVEELKERREQEDEARSRELEEKFLRERSERQARRAERARSISPQKSSPANTPPPPSRDGSSAHTSNALGIRAPSPRHESPGSPVTRARPPSAMMDGSRDYAKENESPFDADSKQSSSGSTSSSIGGPARGPLSWQRRPQSQASDRPKSRPLSVVAAENAASRTSTPVEQTPSEQNPSRDQIAQALAGKDPTWFRQTADRAQGSAAFRKNQVEDPDTLDMSSLRAQLPGMSRESSSEPLREAAEIRPASPGIRAKLGSPLILSPAQRLEPPTPEATSQKDITAGGRTSPTRPLSPTKGMGGFVQSAMMKRSDSVKRWSVNSPAGLQRADSAVSNRSSIDNTHRTSTTLSHSRQNSTLRDGSVTPTRSSRPTSRGTTTPTSRPMSSHDQEQDRHDRGSSNDEKPATDTKADQEEHPLPVSPSKTMDPRRWSPTKSSWLDAALNKPDSPKPKPTPPTSQQPAWMVELNKAKSQKSNSGSPDIGATSPVARKHEVKTGGLMKSSPMGAGVKPAALGASTLSSPRLPPGDKPALGNLRGNLTRRASDKIDQEGAATSSIPAKTKPQTPPKKDLDFRGNLKPRQTPSGAGTSETPDELKNVFGKLRRTQTQNYKAPDELKNNILRGKAALNITGGPKPSDRKDEFKEAILKKKEEFKKAQEEGRSVTKTPKAADEKPIPEGLLKTMEMKRSATTSKRDSATSDVPPQTPIGFSESNRSSTISSISRSDSAGASQLSTPKPAVSSENEPPTSMPTLQKEVSAPGRLQGRAAASGLAGRFNPALAGILARGPPGAGSGAPKTSASSSPQVTSEGAAPEAKSSPGPQLTHMTKNRARGPRRKAPSSVAKTTGDAEPAAPAPAVRTPTLTQPERFEPKTETPEAAESVKHGKPALAPKPQLVSLVDSSKTLATKENPTSVAQVISLVDSSKKTAVEEEPKPSGQPISFGDPAGFKTRPRSPTKVHEKVAALAAQAQPVSKPAVDADDTTSQPPSPRKLNVKRISKFLDEPVQIDTASDTPKPRTPSPTKLGRFAFETDLPIGTSRALPLPPTKSRPLPELVPTASQDHKSDEKVDSEPVVSVKNAKSLFGGAPVKSPEPTRSKPVPADPKPAAETQRPRTPPKPSSRALPPPPETALVSPPMSPMTKYNREVSAVLTSFFGTERPKRSYNVDAAEILMRRPASGARVRTQQAQLFQVSGDGKKQPVPAHNERVLFEREMYLCPHTFTTEAGKKVVEVYFWAGDEVPESAVEDAQVFLQREARAFGGKLVKLTQGKETPEFIQALGGIVIVRRGSSNKYDSLAPNMLCGRRYHGQIAFDEVDFAPSSLCSGFPYLITQQGKCFLWKGKGSDVDELSCARLIGMDLALMGELVEVEDGNEPDEFWRIFGGGSRLGSADHWRLKPNYDKYCGRLFKSDAADRKQIIELSPFSQADLLPTSIYILDAFFEMYIIVGAQAQHQYAAFHNALEFAQEYAILASGMEDRPFVPVSTVVLEGIPRDLKSVFRKWRDSASPTVMNPTFPPGSPLKRGRSLRVVPLNQALQALRE